MATDIYFSRFGVSGLMHGLAGGGEWRGVARLGPVVVQEMACDTDAVEAVYLTTDGRWVFREWYSNRGSFVAGSDLHAGDAVWAEEQVRDWLRTNRVSLVPSLGELPGDVAARLA